METWVVTSIILVLLAALVVFLISKNRKDKKELENQLKDDYHKPKPHDVESEGTDSI